MTKRHKLPGRTSTSERLSNVINKHGVAILLTALGILTSFAIYYLAYSDSDIRPVRGSKMESYISPVAVSQDGKCIYTVSMLQRFTNVSVKSGHIDRANITSWSEDALPEYKMVEIDKDQMSWKDQKNIQLRFTVTLDSTSVAKLSERKEPLEIEIRYYDNTGKLLNIADDNMPIYFYVNLTEPAVRITHLPNLNEQMVH